MNGYIHKASIPTESESNCLVLSDALYFSSHTNIYKAESGIFSIHTSVEGTIRHFAVNSHNVFICTDDRIYMNFGENTIGTLRRSACSIDANDSVFAIGNGNVLEVWDIPREYKFTLFKNKTKVSGHHGPIVVIKIINDDLVLTGSEDNTVRFFNLKEKKSTILAKTRSTPVGIHLFDEDRIAVTSMDGAIFYFNLKTLDDDSTKKLIFIGSPILSASLHGEFLAIAAECPKESPKEVETDHFHYNQPSVQTIDNNVDTQIIVPMHRKPQEKSLIMIYKNGEEIYRAEICFIIDKISLFNQNLSMRARNCVGIFSIPTEKFIFNVDLPRISSFNIDRELIAAGCMDRKVRIYNNHICRNALFDPKSSGDILNAYICHNTCITAYKGGYISAFNITDSTCYRSFSIGGYDVLSTDYNMSAISNDGCMLFMATRQSIFIIDIQRSKCIDEIKLECPLIELVFHRDLLYYLTLSNEICKYNVYNGKCTTMQLETAAIGMTIRNNSMVVSTSAELIFYDLDFNYTDTVGVTLEARHREEVYSKSKPVGFFDFDSKHIICGGQSNQIKVIRHGNESHTKSLCSNEVVQVLRASRNRDWENYKTKLTVEKKTAFNKNNFIEVRKIVACESKFYVLTREGILIYEISKRAFNPIEFNVEVSPEFVTASIKSGNYSAAMLSALQLGDYGTIKMVMDGAQNVEYVVRYIPSTYASLLMDYMLSTLKIDFTNLKALEFIKWIVFYHKVEMSGAMDTIREGCKNDYNAVKGNYYMLQNIMKKNR